MSRLLEGIFVLGCSLVGLGMGAPEGSSVQNAVQSSIQLVAVAQHNVAAKLISHAGLFDLRLGRSR